MKRIIATILAGSIVFGAGQANAQWVESKTTDELSGKVTYQVINANGNGAANVKFECSSKTKGELWAAYTSSKYWGPSVNSTLTWLTIEFAGEERYTDKGWRGFDSSPYRGRIATSTGKTANSLAKKIVSSRKKFGITPVGRVYIRDIFSNGGEEKIRKLAKSCGVDL